MNLSVKTGVMFYKVSIQYIFTEIFIYMKKYCFLSVASSMTCTVSVPVNKRSSVVHVQ